MWTYTESTSAAQRTLLGRRWLSLRSLESLRQLTSSHPRWANSSCSCSTSIQCLLLSYKTDFHVLPHNHFHFLSHICNTFTFTFYLKNTFALYPTITFTFYCLTIFTFYHTITFTFNHINSQMGSELESYTLEWVVTSSSPVTKFRVEWKIVGKGNQWQSEIAEVKKCLSLNSMLSK